MSRFMLSFCACACLYVLIACVRDGRSLRCDAKVLAVALLVILAAWCVGCEAVPQPGASVAAGQDTGDDVIAREEGLVAEHEASPDALERSGEEYRGFELDDVLAASRAPIRLSIGEGDEYYGPDSARQAAEELRRRYADARLSEAEIDRLVVLDVKPSDFFASQGVANQHGGGAALFAHDAEIMGWLFGQCADK